MKTRNLMGILIAAVLVMAASRSAHAWTRPDMNLSAGTTIGADGSINSGGAAVAFSPMWDITDHARFGASLFADDIGSDLGHLYDPNDHADLGATQFGHRWTWGAAWRADVDVAQRGRWSAAASGTWGYWRIVDDSRGTPLAAASAVGVGFGGEVKRQISGPQTLGLVVRWQRLFAERNASYRRVQHYATAAVEWGWAGAPRP